MTLQLYSAMIVILKCRSIVCTDGLIYSTTHIISPPPPCRTAGWFVLIFQFVTHQTSSLLCCLKVRFESHILEDVSHILVASHTKLSCLNKGIKVVWGVLGNFGMCVFSLTLLNKQNELSRVLWCLIVWKWSSKSSQVDVLPQDGGWCLNNKQPWAPEQLLLVRLHKQ